MRYALCLLVLFGSTAIGLAFADDAESQSGKDHFRKLFEVAAPLWDGANALRPLHKDLNHANRVLRDRQFQDFAPFSITENALTGAACSGGSKGVHLTIRDRFFIAEEGQSQRSFERRPRMRSGQLVPNAGKSVQTYTYETTVIPVTFAVDLCGAVNDLAVQRAIWSVDHQVGDRRIEGTGDVLSPMASMTLAVHSEDGKASRVLTVAMTKKEATVTGVDGQTRPIELLSPEYEWTLPDRDRVAEDCAWRVRVPAYLGYEEVFIAPKSTKVLPRLPGGKRTRRSDEISRHRGYFHMGGQKVTLEGTLCSAGPWTRLKDLQVVTDKPPLELAHAVGFQGTEVPEGLIKIGGAGPVAAPSSGFAAVFDFINGAINRRMVLVGQATGERVSGVSVLRNSNWQYSVFAPATWPADAKTECSNSLCTITLGGSS